MAFYICYDDNTLSFQRMGIKLRFSTTKMLLASAGLTLFATLPAHATNKAPAKATDSCKPYMHKTADAVVDSLGKATEIRKTGTDANGLVVEWVYPKCVLTLKRMQVNGISAYHVAEARPN
jgi:hypothetical protein